MTKKSFSKLGQGSEKLSEDLQSFLISGDSPKKKGPEVKIVDIPNIMKETSTNEKKEIEIVEKDFLPKEKEQIALEGETKPVVIKEKKPLHKKVDQVIEDFKSHSILFSEKQLSRLQEKVLLEKLHFDRKFSMKKAIFSAFSMWIEHSGIVQVEYPDDFKTYSALISESQFEKVLNKVYMHKAKVDRNYSLKKALYESIELYLKK